MVGVMRSAWRARAIWLAYRNTTRSFRKEGHTRCQSSVPMHLAVVCWNERRTALQQRKTGLLGDYCFQLSRIPVRIIIISGIWPKPDDLEREESAFREAPVYRYHRNKQKQMGHTSTEEQSLKSLVTLFLADLAHANHSPHTCRAYATDLAQLCAFHQGPIQTITANVLRTFFEMHAQLRPATRARKQAAVARFLTWAEQQELLEANPMRKIDRVKLDPPQLRGVERSHIERILKAIPSEHLRDRLFFYLLAETGLRVSEGLSLYVEDLDLSLDNEHLTVVGKGGKRRTVLLDDPRLVQQFRAYLKRMGYKHGLLFRAEKNGRGGPLRYQSMQKRWEHYCSQAGVACTLHQHRHSHATELINGGVSLPTIRKRLGHKNLQTTLRYAEQADETADAEMRAWRRLQLHHASR
jgi:integrase/recombinase XerD